MIKLIASDLDGTLIPEGTQVMEEGFYEVVEELLRRGYLFYAASGRQYANMRRKFGPLADRIGYICENGALAVDENQPVFCLDLPREKSFEICRDIMAFPETEILISGVKACYIQPRTEWFRDQMYHVLANDCEDFERMEEIDDQIIKLAMYIHGFKDNAPRIHGFFREKYGDYAAFLKGGNDWIDMVIHGTGKGPALNEVLKARGIGPEEILVFGDNENDVSMFDLTPNSYAMEHARPEIKAKANHTVKSVTQFLREFLEHEG